MIQIAVLMTSMSIMSLSAAQELPTQITLVADIDVTPSDSEIVTFGLPLAPGVVFSTDEIVVSSGNKTIPVHVSEGLRWHFVDGSVRSVVIQLQNIDMTSGNIVLTVADSGRDIASDLDEQPQSSGWTNAGPEKKSLPYPRIFALHDPAYLARTGLIPPYAAAPVTGDAIEQLQSRQFDNWAGALNYATSSKGNWLFDRSSAMFKVYMTTGDVKFLKEAILSKQFYFSHVKNDGTPPRQQGGDGCWTYSTVACADGKYIAPQQAKLALALVGDTSQWTDKLIVNMALQADLGWNQFFTRDPYDGETEGFTERAAGLVGLAEVTAYEVTADSAILQNMMERIGSLQDMQQTVKPWDSKNGWLPKSGAFTHSWQVHEGGFSQGNAPLGDTDDRRFSPWMSENIADFLWQAYVVTGDQRIPEMLRRLGNAIDLYGFASSYVSGTGNGASYVRKSGIKGWNACKGPDPLAVELMYFGSAYATNSALQATHISEGYADGHNVEVILPLALAYHFETDANARARLHARIEKIVQQWTETVEGNCSNTFGGTYRLWNWQHRSNSFRTWQLLKAGGPGTVPLPPRLN